MDNALAWGHIDRAIDRALLDVALDNLDKVVGIICFLIFIVALVAHGQVERRQQLTEHLLSREPVAGTRRWQQALIAFIFHH